MNIIFPSGYQVEVSQLRQHLNEAHAAWWDQWRAGQPEFKIENVRFEHDPRWRSRFFSIQSAHDGAHPVWKATHVYMRMTCQII